MKKKRKRGTKTELQKTRSRQRSRCCSFPLRTLAHEIILFTEDSISLNYEIPAWLQRNTSALEMKCPISNKFSLSKDIIYKSISEADESSY